MKIDAGKITQAGGRVKTDHLYHDRADKPLRGTLVQQPKTNQWLILDSDGDIAVHGTTGNFDYNYWNSESWQLEMTEWITRYTV